MNNTQYFIDKYSDTENILVSKYKNFKNIDISDIINPIKIDNRQLCTVPDNQGDSPCCTGYAVSNLFESVWWKKTGKLININAEQIYAKSKTLENNINNGTSLESALSSAFILCNVPENKININFISYNDINFKEKLKFIIHKYDFLISGFRIFSSWYKCSEKNYILSDSGIPMGNHAVLVVGYDKTGCYIQNSWGRNWGYKSFAIIPWEYFKDNFKYGCYIDFNIL